MKTPGWLVISKKAGWTANSKKAETGWDTKSRKFGRLCSHVLVCVPLRFSRSLDVSAGMNELYKAVAEKAEGQHSLLTKDNVVRIQSRGCRAWMAASVAWGHRTLC